MKAYQHLFKDQPLRFFNDTHNDRQPYQSFALDDALIESIAETHMQAIRLWSHDQTIILGIADTKLPHFETAVKHLKSQGYNVVVRNSGGLAVVADNGVLSISILLPDAKQISIHDGYEQMVQLVKEIFRPWTEQIEAFEVVGSYCPGDYDLSINGKKFAGISQRRVKNGISVQIYLAITPDHQARAKLIKQFYQLGINGQATKFTYPTIQPDTMEALATLLAIDLSIDDVMTRITNVLTADFHLVPGELTADELTYFNKREQQMIDRNKKALGDLF